MYATHWFRLLALLLYVAGVVLILSKCAGVFPSAPPQTPAPKQVPGDAVPDAVVREQRDLEEKRARRAAEIARRQAVHHAQEAALKVLRETDLPRAFADLAREALRYQNKLADLARLEPAARWERERPVKDARDYAYRLVLQYQAVDREAQKEREAATLYQDSDVALFTEHFRTFRRGGEGMASFATLVPAFAGQVPEPLLLEAIDAITMAALPADAYDPCRDPAACPKPSPPVEDKTPDNLAARKPSTASEASRSPEPFANPPKRYCLNASRLSGRPLPLRTEPDPSAPMVARIAATSCMITANGRRVELGSTTWLQVTHDYGYTGWVQERFLIPASHRPEYDDFFSGLFGNAPRRR